MRQFAKRCDVRDFEDADVLRALRDILPERDPLAHVERKVWEFAMLALFLEETGRLCEGSDILAVGAGDERMVFWLANRAGRVVASDIYGQGAFAGAEARATMLEDPAAHAPFPYREDRLEVAFADAQALPFADAEFDAVYSLSSIEHFGDPPQAAREIGRVLRPGGHAFLATDCYVRLHPLDRWRAREVFTVRELGRRIVAPSGLELMQPLDLSLSAASWDNLTTTRVGGRLEAATGGFYPHILLKAKRSVFTSICLPLRKPDTAA